MIALESLSIPRWLGLSNDCTEVQLHGFCDASEAAYGACLYLRCTAADGTITVRLITSKSRVAPLESLQRKKKKMSIPRLELSSALLLSHLYEKYTQVQPNIAAFFWTDSMIVKCWLASLPSRWQIFVANRVSEIQHLTKDGVWGHVPGTENPADLISRGMSPAHLQYQTLWFEGPRWLSQEQQFWPNANEITAVELDPAMLEERPSPAFPAQVVPPSEIFGERSSYTELVRIVALLLRFRHNAQQSNRKCRKIGRLSLDEQEQAILCLVRLSQQECYPQELKSLAKHGCVHDSSNIAALHPILCDGALRVGGRLSKASISSDRKHPYILHHNHPFAAMVVRYYHHKLFHAGQQLLIASVRGKFWPVHIHSLARRVIHECIPCFRNKPKVLEQIMSDLPSARVNPAPPFTNVGLDYCGPFQVNYSNRRASLVKCCVATWNHLELVMDQITQAFLAALKWFATRRGKPRQILCDYAPPLKWYLCRVVNCFEGSNGNIHVVSVRTKDGCFDRGFSKVCSVPIRDNEEVQPSNQ